MPLKSYRPYTPSRRFITTDDFSMITRTFPEKSLTLPLKKKGGRNNTGRVMVPHRGGGHKRLYRIIDFKRDKTGVKGRVVSVEYDPNRSSRIALIEYEDKEKRYILQPEGLKVGDEVLSGPDAEIKTGNALSIANMPLGTIIHNIELLPGNGGKLVRSAGSWAQLMAKEERFAHVRMPSGEIRFIRLNCMATVGQVGNVEHGNVTLGKAGRSRHSGFKPIVRGTAMNAVDHPHGGGRGKSKGHNHPVSYSNIPCKGFKTRKKKVWDWMIVSRRKSKAGVA
ncbi:MAG: 50S ribosomal protein L2 [Elusimicrobia bacterium]|nr:50S ribosomal protein L2 [Elusimicrobiota bacterium]